MVGTFGIVDETEERHAPEAGVRRVEPFHFSPRYDGEEARMVGEVMAAFGGGAARPGELR